MFFIFPAQHKKPMHQSLRLFVLSFRKPIHCPCINVNHKSRICQFHNETQKVSVKRYYRIENKDQTKNTLSAEAGHVNILFLQILLHYYMVNIGPQMPSLFASLSAYK